MVTGRTQRCSRDTHPLQSRVEPCHLRLCRDDVGLHNERSTSRHRQLTTDPCQKNWRLAEELITKGTSVPGPLPTEVTWKDHRLSKFQKATPSLIVPIALKAG